MAESQVKLNRLSPGVDNRRGAQVMRVKSASGSVQRPADHHRRTAGNLIFEVHRRSRAGKQL